MGVSPWPSISGHAVEGQSMGPFFNAGTAF